MCQAAEIVAADRWETRERENPGRNQLRDNDRGGTRQIESQTKDTFIHQLLP